MAINFSSPWWLWLLIPVGWSMWQWWKREQRFSKAKKIMIFTLRLILFSLLIFALARMELLFPVQHQSIVFVVDRSASIQQPDAILNSLRQALQEKKPDDQFAVVTVGSQAVVEQSLTTHPELYPFSAVVNRNATDLESGLRLAGAMLPADARGRVVLITDGKETEGSALAATRELKQRGIRVDVYSLTSQTGPEVLVSGVQVPQRIFVNEEATLKVQVESTVETDAMIRLYEANRMIKEQKVHVQKGDNQYLFSSQVKESGFLRYRVEIQAGPDTLPNNNQAFGISQVEGTPQVLVVEGKAGEGANLVSALQATGVQVERVSPSGLPVQLEGYKRYSSVVLVNTPAYLIPNYKMQQLHTAVKDLGVGLVMTGGEESFGLGGWFQTPIEEALPVHMDIKDKKRMPSLGLMLVIDKSGSMSGEKIELAKEAAIRATELLTPNDQLGVLAFDDGNEWIIQPQPVHNRKEMQDQIGGIPADGGTNIFPALAQGYEEIRKLKVKRKHIILLTDGQSPGGNYEELTEKMNKEGITLSTIAVGSDAAQGLLEQIAKWGKGRYYFSDNPSSIPTIFSKETTMASRSYIIDQPFTPKWVGGADWFVRVKGVPPLKAYIGTTAKQTAETVLASPYPDPVLARWQYGLGRTIAWTSDVNGKWSKEWVTWSKFPLFWSQMISWTFPQYQTSGFYLDSRLEGSTVKIKAKTATNPSAFTDQIQLQVLDDQGKSKVITAKAVAPGEFEASFPVQDAGTYLVQATAKDGKISGTAGIVVPYSTEFSLSKGINQLPQRIAEQGNGKVLNDLKQAFADELEMKWAGQEVSRLLLWFATLLWPFEIAVRRLSITREDWQRFRKHFSRNITPAISTYTEQIGKLQQKSREVIQKRTSPMMGKEFSTEQLRVVEPQKVTEAQKGTENKQNQRTQPQTETKDEVKSITPIETPATTEQKEETHLSRLLAAKRKRELNQ